MTRLWGGELSVNGKEFNDQCYFMTPVWVKQPAEFNFRIIGASLRAFPPRARVSSPPAAVALAWAPLK